MRHLVESLIAPQRRPLWCLLTALLLVAITTLALVPHPPERLSTGWDKANHALAFASLTFASVWAVCREPRCWGWLAAALLAYGGGIEIAQTFLPPREGEWLDLLADGVGISLGLLAATAVRAFVQRRA